MKYFEYSPSQLEAKANELTEKYDKERLVRAKHIDVYDIVDLIGCTPDWFYITPDLSVLGMTAFYDVCMYSWPYDHYEKGMICSFSDMESCISGAWSNAVKFCRMISSVFCFFCNSCFFRTVAVCSDSRFSIRF